MTPAAMPLGRGGVGPDDAHTHGASWVISRSLGGPDVGLSSWRRPAG